MKPGDKYKTSFVISYSQYLYLQMGQGFIGISYTNSQFSDIIFGHFSYTSLINIY